MGVRRGGQTTAPDTPWKRSSSFPQNDSNISWKSPQEKEPSAGADTSSSTKTSPPRDEAARSTQAAAKKQHPSSVAVSRDSNGQFQQTYTPDNKRSNTSTNSGAPWEAHHRSVSPPPRPAPPAQGQQRRTMFSPEQRQQLIFDQDSPLERYEQQRKESFILLLKRS